MMIRSCLEILIKVAKRRQIEARSEKFCRAMKQTIIAGGNSKLNGDDDDDEKVGGQ